MHVCGVDYILAAYVIVVPLISYVHFLNLLLHVPAHVTCELYGCKMFSDCQSSSS